MICTFSEFLYESQKDKPIKFDEIKRLFAGPDLRYVLNLNVNDSGVVTGTDGKNYNVTFNGGKNVLYKDDRTWFASVVN